MNFFSVVGRVGRDPLLGKAGETPVLNFSVAFDTGYKDKKTTTWLSCALWGKRAEAISPYLRKGQQVSLGGEIRLRAWEKDGKTGTVLEMDVAQLTLPPKAADAPASAPPPDFNEDDIPF